MRRSNVITPNNVMDLGDGLGGQVTNLSRNIVRSRLDLAWRAVRGHHDQGGRRRGDLSHGASVYHLNVAAQETLRQVHFILDFAT